MCYCPYDDLSLLLRLYINRAADEGAACIAFAAEFEHRSSDKLDRMEVINAFAQQIKCPPHKASRAGQGVWFMWQRMDKST